MQAVKKLWRTHRLTLSAFVLASAVTLFFLVRFVVGLVYWSVHENEPVQPWMTVGYIGRSWHLNPRVLDAEAGLPPPAGHPLTLSEIARDRGVPVATVIAEVEAAIVRLKAKGRETQP